MSARNRYVTIYSREVQPCGPVMHLSVSVDTPGKLPNKFSVDAIANAFGFPQKRMYECANEGKTGVIHVLALLVDAEVN